MRILYMGTPKLAATVLEALAADHDVVGVVTRPDAIRGRGSKTAASPVKDMALNLGLTVYERTSMKGIDAEDLVKSLAPDAICVAACGIILPREILEIPQYGCFNVHTSLLPRWRGAAPIERSIIAGDDTTGVCIMRMEEGLDTGPYCRRVEVQINGMYVDDLSDALARTGSTELLAALESAEEGSITWTDQADEGVSYAEKIRKGELSLDEDECAYVAVAKVRASSPAHPARATVAGRTLAVEKASLVADDQGLSLCNGMRAGEARFARKRLFLGAKDGAFELERVRPDGKNSMDARSFAGGIQGIKTMQLTWGRT